jgi:hypothetical protein
MYKWLIKQWLYNGSYNMIRHDYKIVDKRVLDMVSYHIMYTKSLINGSQLSSVWVEYVVI